MGNKGSAPKPVSLNQFTSAFKPLVNVAQGTLTKYTPPSIQPMIQPMVQQASAIIQPQPQASSSSPEFQKTLTNMNNEMRQFNTTTTLSLNKIQSSIDGTNNIIKTAFETTIPNVINSIQSQNLQIQQEFQAQNLSAMSSMSDNILAGSQRIIDQATEQNLQLNTLQQKIYANSITEMNSIAGIKTSIDNIINEAKEDIKYGAIGLATALALYFIVK